MKRGQISRRGQSMFGLPFAVIFSIILIIMFVIIGFIAVRAALKSSDCARMGIFIDDSNSLSISSAINNAWSSDKISFEYEGRLPDNLEYICFADMSKSFRGKFADIGSELSLFSEGGENLFFYPIENSCNIYSHNIEHLDLDSITFEDNPYCVGVDNGKVIIKINKELNEPLVRIQ